MKICRYKTNNGTAQSQGAIKNRQAMQRYRAKVRRFDYAPCPEALAAIEKHLSVKLDNGCLAGAIDRLILAGNKAISGNSGNHA